jgi:hypothetical protein
MDGGIGPRARGFGGFQYGQQLIQNLLLTIAQASINLSNIPQYFNHLLIIGSCRVSSAVTSSTCFVQYNGDTGANYAFQYYGAAGAGVGAASAGGQVRADIFEAPGNSATANTFGVFQTTISRYSSNLVFKSHVGMSCATSNAAGVGYNMLGTWNSLAPINSILLFPNTGNFMAGTQISLYGIY